MFPAAHPAPEPPANPMPQLQQPLPDGPLDLIGDVHGEIDALRALLHKLGVDLGRGTVRRKLVFLGDLVDRGPDSIAVVQLVQRLVELGHAQVVLGNHELNLLRGQNKDGSGWFHGNADERAQTADGPGARYDARVATQAERAEALAFFRQLPLVVARPDLVVAHACPDPAAVAQLPEHADVIDWHTARAAQIAEDAKRSGLAARAEPQRALYAAVTPATINDGQFAALVEFDLAKQLGNPVKVLTSGQEQAADHGKPLVHVGGKFRIVQRTNWWQSWSGAQAAVVGHYWRQRDEAASAKCPFWQYGRFGWVNRVFCVDYSVGRRFVERANGHVPSRVGLAALRWPERTLVFDDVGPADGVPTTGFGPA